MRGQDRKRPLRTLPRALGLLAAGGAAGADRGGVVPTGEANIAVPCGEENGP